MLPYESHASVVKLLLEANADVNAKSTHNRITSLYAASEKGHDSVVKLLLEAKVDVNADSACTALMAASLLCAHRAKVTNLS